MTCSMFKGDVEITQGAKALCERGSGKWAFQTGLIRLRAGYPMQSESTAATVNRGKKNSPVPSLVRPGHGILQG